MTEHWPIIAALAIAAVLGGLAWRAVTRAWRKWKTQRRFRHGARGEEKARAALRRRGFEILEEQARRFPLMYVGGKEESFEVRADYLVRRKGRRAVVEVKTGTRAPDPTYRNTRRQLLEYARCYDVDDIHLYDADSDTLREIRFAGAAASAPSRWRGFRWGFGLGVVLTTGALVALQVFVL